MKSVSVERSSASFEQADYPEFAAVDEMNFAELSLASIANRHLDGKKPS